MSNRISRGIPGFHNGISQQAAANRLPSQVADAVNVFPSLVEGMTDRPPLKHIKKLNTTPGISDYFVHLYNRDATERYVVLIGNQTIKVYDMAGNEKTVNTPDGLTYLASSNPRQDFAAVTVADYTFILNKTVEVAMDKAEEAEDAPYEAIVWVKRGVQSNKYTVTLGVTDYTVTTGDSNSPATYRTDQIASDLKALIEAGGGGYTVYRKGSVLKISRSTDFTFAVWDSYGETGIKGMKHTVDKYTDLPPNCWDGVRLNVLGDGKDVITDYYVEYTSEDGASAGVWKESRGWSQSNLFDDSTMPMQLVREPDGTFTLERCLWDERMVGDDDTCPLPSFVGRRINDIFFFRNRLGFISDENVIFSRAGEFFNFFPESVTDVLDTDPIDTTASHVKVSILNHAVPYSKSLLLFSDQTQFMLTSDTMLTPNDIKIDQTTEFACSSRCKPIGQGPNVYFVNPRGNYDGIMEYFMQEDTVTNDAADITAHVPKLIPSGVHKLIGSPNTDIFFALNSDEPQTLFGYKYYWSGNEKLQSAWVKWELSADNEIIGGDLIDTTMYLIIKRSDGFHLMSMSVEEGAIDDIGFLILLDNRVELTGVYDAGNDWTTWTLPYELATNIPLTVVFNEDWEDAGTVLSPVTRPSTTTVRAAGDWHDHAVFIGLPYTAEATWSRQFVKEGGDDGKPIVGGRLQLLDGTIYYENSGGFEVEVSATGRATSTYQLNRRLGTPEFTLGDIVFYSGSFTFPILADSREVTIKMRNSSYLRSCWHAAEYSANFVLNSRRA